MDDRRRQGDGDDMSWSSEERPCAWIRERLEAFLDGDLSPDESSLTELHVAECKRCAHELASAQRISRSLRAMPQMRCPDHVVEKVYRKTRVPGYQRLRQLLSALRRPVFAGATVVMLLAVVTLVGLQWQRPAVVSAEEIALAQTEAKWALAKVREVSQRATTTVREDVLRRRVVYPMRRAMVNSIKIKTQSVLKEDDNAG